MRGIVKGCNPMNYFSEKKNRQVEGVNLNIEYEDKDWFGVRNKEESFDFYVPMYSKILKPFMSDLDSLIGAEIYIEYMPVKRGNYSFTEIVDIKVTSPDLVPAKK